MYSLSKIIENVYSISTRTFLNIYDVGRKKKASIANSLHKNFSFIFYSRYYAGDNSFRLLKFSAIKLMLCFRCLIWLFHCSKLCFTFHLSFPISLALVAAVSCSSIVYQFSGVGFDI